MESPQLWIAAGLGFVAIALVAFALTLVLDSLRDRQKRKEVVSQLRGLEASHAPEGHGPAILVLRESEAAGAAWLQPFVQRIARTWNLEMLLRQAGLRWGVQRLLLLMAGFAVALGLLTFVLTSRVPYAVVAAALGAYLPLLHVRRKKTKRLDEFEEQFPEAVELMARSLRAGHPFSASLKMASEECDQPIRGELRQAFEEQRLGLPMDDSLVGIADRVDLIDVRIFVTAVMIQREVGGNLAEVLDNLSAMIRERFKLRGKLRTLAAEGVMSMWVMLVLPPAMTGIMLLINREYIMTLFREPAGKAVVLACLAMQTLGYFWMRRIIQIKI